MICVQAGHRPRRAESDARGVGEQVGAEEDEEGRHGGRGRQGGQGQVGHTGPAPRGRAEALALVHVRQGC